MILYPKQLFGVHCRSTYGIPEVMTEILQALHDGMFAIVIVGGGKSEPFSVQSILCQGCTIAPTLFILTLD